jgi:adenylate cyclase
MSTARANSHNGAAPEGLSIAEAAERVGVAPSTLRRWARHGLALAAWAVEFQRLEGGRILPRIAVHYGNALYRDGDYYGRDVNIASRVGARAAGAEVLVTRSVVEQARADLEFERIGDVRLKGFTESTEIFVARRRDGAE